MENFLNWIERVLGFIKNYGFTRILQSWIIVFVFSFTVAILIFPTKTITTLYEITEKIQSNKHTEEIEMSKFADLSADELLDKCVMKFDCYEACVLEPHNGVSSLSGMSFRNLSIRKYASSVEPNPGQRLYKNWDTPMGMTRINNYINNNERFFGTAEEFKSLDYDLAERFEENGVKYVILIGVPDSKKDDNYIGYLVLTYTEEPEYSANVLFSRLQKYVDKLEELLLKENK